MKYFTYMCIHKISSLCVFLFLFLAANLRGVTDKSTLTRKSNRKLSGIYSSAENYNDEQSCMTQIIQRLNDTLANRHIESIRSNNVARKYTKLKIYIDHALISGTVTYFRWTFLFIIIAAEGFDWFVTMN